MARRRPLHTCATSCLNIAHRACAKCQDLDGPIAKRAVTFLNFFSPFLHSILRRCFAILSIIDDHILTFQNRIETIFPKSAFFFDRVDGIISKAELLPEQVEDAARRFPSMMIHQFPLLDRIIARLISWLSFLLSILTHKSTREKEITIDVNCKTVSEEKAINPAETSKSVHLLENGNGVSTNPKHSKTDQLVHLSVKRLHPWKSRIKALEEPLYAGDSPMYSSYQSANSSPVSDHETQDDNIHQTGMSCTYKEMLERGTKEDAREEEDTVRS